MLPMSGLSPDDVERILSDSDPELRGTLAEMIPLVYDELRALARRYLARERQGHTLQPTALVHEAYLRLAAQPNVRFASGPHLLGLAARMMRRVLVDHARRRGAGRRGAGAVTVTLDEAMAPLSSAPLDVLAVDEALERLHGLDARQARIVELRLFGGLTVEETAEATGISEATVKREWRTAKVFLSHELKASAAR